MNKKILVLLLVLALFTSIPVLANSKTKDVNKNKRLTPKEKEVRKQMFNNAVQNGGNRAKYYNIYY